jgi:hypothetical protein
MTATRTMVPTAPRPISSTTSGAVVTMGTERSAMASGMAVPAITGTRTSSIASTAPARRPAR